MRYGRFFHFGRRARDISWSSGGGPDNPIETAIGIVLLPFALVWLLCSGIISLFRDQAAYTEHREREEAEQSYLEIKHLYEATPYAAENGLEKFCTQLGAEICGRGNFDPTDTFSEALYLTLKWIIDDDGVVFGLPKFDPSAKLNLEEGVALRNTLRRKQYFLENHARLAEIIKTNLIRAIEETIRFLPAHAYIDENSDGSASLPSPLLFASLIDMCDEPAKAIERTIIAFFDEAAINAGQLETIRTQLERNLLEASGIPWDERDNISKPLRYPTDEGRASNRDLIETYLSDTPFEYFFLRNYPLSIPFPARFEHTLVVGGTGHGKTQLLQLLINHDLLQAKKDHRSVIIIDSQGDLIRTIGQLAYFDPAVADTLADRLMIIDPNDVEYPCCLNMFDFNRERLASFRPVDREKVLNATIELYEYIFGALLGAELTQKQGVIFKYLARLMLEIPDATIHTLRELMENGERFRLYMEKLPGTARSFFETRFFDRGFNETKKQILVRLWGVLSSPTFERMFSYPRSKVDIFDAINSGKIILINTAKELLKQDGCAIFGRFFIALIAQAAVQRATIPAHRRRPTFVFIDEAQDYFDENVGHLLNQARKYRIGMVLAHQNLDQLPPALRASVMASTSIKFAGGVSAKDATTLASEMRCDSAFVQAMRKKSDHSNFACYVRNLTAQAIGVAIPLGHVEQLPTLSRERQQVLIERNRSRYCAPAEQIDALQRHGESQKQLPAPATSAHVAPLAVARSRQKEPDRIIAATAEPPASPVQVPEPVPAKRSSKTSHSVEPATLGRGGKQHKYLQQMIKQVAEERNFRATVEEPLDEGGKVDVALTVAEKRIACEVSVTTSGEQELGNIEKCLAAGYTEVIIVGASERHLTSLRKFVLPNLEEADQDKLKFLSIENLIGYLNELAASAAPTETLVRGYKVRTTRKVVTEEEAQARKQAIAQVIARSIKQLGSE